MNSNDGRSGLGVNRLQASVGNCWMRINIWELEYGRWQMTGEDSRMRLQSVGRSQIYDEECMRMFQIARTSYLLDVFETLISRRISWQNLIPCDPC